MSFLDYKQTIGPLCKWNKRIHVVLIVSFVLCWVWVVKPDPVYFVIFKSTIKTWKTCFRNEKFSSTLYIILWCYLSKFCISIHNVIPVVFYNNSYSVYFDLTLGCFNPLFGKCQYIYPIRVNIVWCTVKPRDYCNW